MPSRAVSVLEFVQAVQAAIASDFGREDEHGNNVLVVQRVDLQLQTALTLSAAGKLEWRVITVGGDHAQTQRQTLSLSWERQPTRLEALVPGDLGYQLVTGLDALRIGAREWARVSGTLPFRSTGGELVFHLAVNEDGSLAVGGLGAGAAREQMHTVTLTLAPLP
ncbi:trypco2 family protein [Deinococcus budaensis]|uniref:Uncharacterized protein n=1 Tax=Deinococcus budaensis TaxID=1665626 RepID=A0A7W8GG23_9DEIO|nr:trypco2 family protein [Deinococcus budaensis]MBB5234793.1 hypothetical protein [Deinococcus budaensis]